MADLLAARLAHLSSREMVDALGLRAAPRWIRRWGEVAFTTASRPLGAALARFDRAIAAHGIAEAARRTLAHLGADVAITGSMPPAGAALVIANHPGAYDALALMAALGRRDLAILAADRAFLRALPNLAPHLLPIGDRRGRATALRRALRHLKDGGALLHFGAGCIEPDPAFAMAHEEVVSPWAQGTEILMRAAPVHVAMVAGVHSARAKSLWVTRMAEKRGVTTLAPLVQVALPGFRDVRVRVAMAKTTDDIAEARAAMRALRDRL